MLRKSIVFGLLTAFILTFVGTAHPAAAAGTCIGISGSYSANSTSFISPTFPLQKNDNVFVTSMGTGKATGVGAIIIINGFQSVFQAAGNAVGGSASAAATGSGHVKFINDQVPGETINWTIYYGATCGQTELTFTDGRVNSHDAVETASIYCESDNSVTVWAVINSQGYFAFHATVAEINKVPVNPVKNTLIKSAMNIALYRLTTGELQVNAPDNYVFIWKGCPNI